MHSSLYFHPGHPLSQPELLSARMDGLLIEVGTGFMPPDLPEDAAARMRSLAPILLTGYAASGPTAAWVHGIGDAPPSRHHLQRITAHRTRTSSTREIVLHDRRLTAGDVQIIAATPVTTLVRALVDLVLDAAKHPESELWMYRTAHAAPELLEPVRKYFESWQRTPGKRTALALVAELAAYDEVTR